MADDWAIANLDDVELVVNGSDELANEAFVVDEDKLMHDSIHCDGIVDNDVCDSSKHLIENKKILKLKDLLNMYTLIQARLRLTQVCWDQGMLRAGYFRSQEIIQGLLSVAMYDVSSLFLFNHLFRKQFVFAKFLN